MSDTTPIRPGENKLPVPHTNSTPSKIRSIDSAIARAKAAKKNVAAPLGKRLQTSYPIDKPNRSKFVRVHPHEGYRMSYVPTYKDEDTGDIYFVDPDLELPEEIASQIRLTDLYAAQAHDGTFFIWFVNRSDTSWYRSANRAVQRSVSQWVRVVSRKSANIYDLYLPEQAIPEPEWSELPPFQDMVENGFDDRRITSISTAFGWTMAVDQNTRWNTVLNFPQQATCAELLRLTLVLAVERGLGPMLCAPHHDAFYLECEEAEADEVEAELESCFRDAVGVVLSGRVHLRLESGVVRYPDHYWDEDGVEIWKIVEGYLEAGARDREQGSSPAISGEILV